VFASPALAYFLYNEVDAEWFAAHPEALQRYSELDDSDIWSALKVWAQSDDKILRLLASDLLERKIFKVEVREECPTDDEMATLRNRLAEACGVSKEEADYLFSLNKIGKDMYDIHDDHISILYSDGTLKDIAEASEILNIELLSKKICKYYLCYQRIS
jgi:hypothetical protein